MNYLDNAATSGRKPDQVYTAVDNALRNCSGNPGRSGHQLSLAAGQIVKEARIKCAGLLNAEEASCISFTVNTTTALNTAIMGTVRPGSHIITSVMEHNSVSRPLMFLREHGCELTVLPASIENGVDPDELKNALRPETSLVVMTHVSNVTGTVNDIAALGTVCKEAEVPFLVDAAQSAGTRPIDVQKDLVDMFAFPGHKGLLGPQGTGGLYVRKDLKIEPLTRGGTGSHSELSEQPEEMPDRLESGTLNVPGLAGLAAGVDFLLETGIDEIRKKEEALRKELLDGLVCVPGIRIFSPGAGSEGGCVVSFRLKEIEPQETALILDSSFQIAVRAGLHCAPFAHEWIGTISSGGTVRVSPGYFNTSEEIHDFINAIEQIGEAYR